MESESRRPTSWGDRILYGVFVALPFAAVAVLAWKVAAFLSVGFSWPIWGAVLIGIVVAVLVVVFFIAGQGHDETDVIVGSILALIVGGVVLSVLTAAKQAQLQRGRQRHVPGTRVPVLPRPQHLVPKMSAVTSRPIVGSEGVRVLPLYTRDQAG